MVLVENDADQRTPLTVTERAAGYAQLVASIWMRSRLPRIAVAVIRRQSSVGEHRWPHIQP